MTFLDLATHFAAVIPIVSRDEIPQLIDATFDNFSHDNGRKRKVFVSDNLAEYVAERVSDTLYSSSCDGKRTSTYSSE